MSSPSVNNNKRHSSYSNSNTNDLLDPTSPFDPYYSNTHLSVKWSKLGFLGNFTFFIIGWSTWLLTSKYQS